MKTALLISTYNWAEALELVFESILNQTEMPDQILIADDGSSIATKDLIEKFENRISIPVKHIWHEDKGFRKSKILNKAVASSDSDYIIQVDGDCILHKRFVEDHKKQAESNVYLYGSRVNILPEFVDKVLGDKISFFNLFSPYIKNKTRTLYIPFLAKLYKKHNQFSKKFRGCNVSYWRKDFIEINGYNEEFEGWGREDSDLMIRMVNKEVQGRRLRYMGIVYHIYHKEKSKQNLEINDQIHKLSIDNKIVRCKIGVDQYLNIQAAD